MSETVDAIVVGSGPNGLAAAVTLAAAGLSVLVIEGANTPGGGCRTEEITAPGFRHDLCSTSHPLGVASPFFLRFGLEARGVRFAHPEVVVGHPLDGGGAGVIRRSLEETAEGMGRDGGHYRRVVGPLVKETPGIVNWVFSAERSLPGHPLALSRYGLRGLGPASALLRSFRSDEARGALAGIAAHAMRPLDTAPTAGVALLLTMLAHRVGWPFVVGGTASIVDAMVEAIRQGGGRLQTGWWIHSLAELPKSRAVLLDVSPRELLALGGDRLPSGYRRALERYRYGPGVCKVDYALSAPVPWSNPDCRKAGTVHLGGTFEEILSAEAEVARGGHPERPYVLSAQATVADPSRAPAGQHTLWAYCHVPNGSDQDMSDRIEAQVERFAPGFRDLVVARRVRTARQLAEYDPTCVGGDIACGAQDLVQTFARPAVRWDPYRTPLADTYLCSAATTPGPGVHGLCGELAALSALRHTFGIRRRPALSRLGRPATT